MATAKFKTRPKNRSVSMQTRRININPTPSKNASGIPQEDYDRLLNWADRMGFFKNV